MQSRLRFHKTRTAGCRTWVQIVAVSFGLATAALMPARADEIFTSTYQGVSELSANGTFIQQLSLPVNPNIGDGNGGFIDPTGIAIGSDGSVYVADYQANETSTAGVIYHFSSSGTYLGVFTSGTSLSEPQGIAFGPNGDLYVTNYNYNNSYLTAYDSTGTEVTLSGTGGPVGGLGLSPPAGGVAFGTNSDLYIPDPYNGIDQYASDGAYLQSFGYADPLNDPSGVAVDSNGNVFVADGSGNQVVEFDSSGNYLATLSGNWDQPVALAFSPNETLYISDDNGITEDNSGTLTNINQFYGGDFIAYDATGVPEPSMVLACTVGLLALLWKRRQLADHH